MAEIRKIKRTKRMPSFVIEMWKAENWGVKEKGIGKNTQKSLWQGTIEHVQSGKRIMFATVSEMLKFIEDRRA